MRANPTRSTRPQDRKPLDPTQRGPRARSFERSHWEWTFREAQRTGRGFACALMVIDGAEHVKPSLRADWEARVLVEIERAAERLRDSREILFGVDQGRALLALLDTDIASAGGFAARVADHARSAFGATPPFEVSIGVASNHAPAAAELEGLFLETLLGVAEDGAEVAGVGGTWIHTELYGLVQRRLVSQDFRAPSAVRREPLTEEPSEEEPSPEEPVTPAVPEPGSPEGAAADPAPIRPAPSRSAPVEDGWREIRPRQAAAEPPPVVRGARVEPPETGLSSLVLRALQGAGLNRPEASAAEAALLPLLGSYMDAQRSRSAEESRAHVGRLERRIAKLNRQLEELERVHAGALEDLESGAAGDSMGISSTYREAQGLSPRDGQFQLKSDLLQAILHANLELVACSARPSEPGNSADSGLA